MSNLQHGSQNQCEKRCLSRYCIGFSSPNFLSEIERSLTFSYMITVQKSNKQRRVLRSEKRDNSSSAFEFGGCVRAC